MSKRELTTEERETLGNIPEGQVAFRATQEDGVFELDMFRKEFPEGEPVFRLNRNDKTIEFFGPKGEVIYVSTGDLDAAFGTDVVSPKINAAWNIHPHFDQMLLHVINESLVRMLAEEMAHELKNLFAEGLRASIKEAAEDELTATETTAGVDRSRLN